MSNNSSDDSKRDILKPSWKNFALRAQNVPRKNNNPAIVQMTVLVNGDGNPTLWTEPKVILLEPRLDLDLMALNSDLKPEEMQVLLEVIAARG